MGQYHFIVNLDKREFIDPGYFGIGLKAWEQLASFPSTPQALFALLICSNGRGGGDLDNDPRVGRWAGDRIAVVGAYADDSDLEPEHSAGNVYQACNEGAYVDISPGIRPIVGKALGVRYEDTPGRLTLADGTVENFVNWTAVRDPQAHFSVLNDETDNTNEQ